MDARTMTLRGKDVAGADPDACPESWDCIDCGVNTGPGHSTRYTMHLASHPDGLFSIYSDKHEIYTVTRRVWKRAGSPDGCLCIGCLEGRIGRRLTRKDFPMDDPLNWLPGSPRLMQRRGRR
jgi:hypothetical protein